MTSRSPIGPFLTTILIATIATATILPPYPRTPASLPAGTIISWHGDCDQPPAGWILCDGTNGTPNLRDRFIVGAGPLHPAGDTGGHALLGLDQLTVSPYTHAHTIPSGTGDSPAGQMWATDNTGPYQVYSQHVHGPGDYLSDSDTHTHTISGTIDVTPPYYALCYLMKATNERRSR